MIIPNMTKSSKKFDFSSKEELPLSCHRKKSVL